MRRIAAVTVATLVLGGLSVVLATAAQAAPSAGTFVSITPKRIVDTRYGVGVPKAAVGARHSISPVVAGAGHPVPATAGSVQVTITVLSTAGGWLTAYGPGARPGTLNVQFSAGRVASDSATVAVASGKITLYNGAAGGSAQIVVDVTGYWLGGSASATDPGVLHLITPKRVLDTRTDAPKKAVAAHGVLTTTLAGSGRAVPAGAGAVAVTVSTETPTQSGALIFYPAGTVRTGLAAHYFTARQANSTFVIVPLSSTGGLSIYNTSAGSVNVVLDITGYYVGGIPLSAGALRPLPLKRFDIPNVVAGQTVGAQIGGVGGVPRAVDTLALVTITVVAPAAGGGVTAWQSAVARPGVTTLQYSAGQTTSAVALVPVSSTGWIDLYNASSGRERLVVDLDGYLPVTAVPAPAGAAQGRYPNDVAEPVSDDAAAMTAHGCADAHDGAKFVLLDVGAQSVSPPTLSKVVPGVVLTQTGTRTALPYADLVTVVVDYLTGYADCAPGGSATVAVGTNNDGVFAPADPNYYAPNARGTDWANAVINPIVARAPTGLIVIGADDIEAAFASTEKQAQDWETAYLAAATPAELVYNGDANDCPTVFGAIGATCAFGWTEAQYYALAHNGTRIEVLPQIFGANEATKWANIDATGGGGLTFLGALTEHAIVASEYDATQGRAALYRALSTVVTAPSVPYGVDIMKDA